MILPLMALVLALLLTLANPAGAEFEDRHPGIRAAGVGGAFTGVLGDAESIFANPAGLGAVPRSELGSMHTALFGDRDLTYDTVQFVQPLQPFGVAGIASEAFGSEIYMERTLRFALARRITNRESLGVTVKLMRSDIRDTPSARGLSLDAGVTARLDPKLTLGLMVADFNNPRVNDLILRTFKGGLAYYPSENLRITADYHHLQGENRGSLILGEEYRATKFLRLRAGYSLNPARLSAGFGLEFRTLSLDYAYRNHEELDNTHRVALSLRFD